MARFNWKRTLTVGGALAAVAFGPAAYAEAAATPKPGHHHIRVQLEPNGDATPAELDRMSAALLADFGEGAPGAIVVLVHGFAQKDWTSYENYEVSAQRLKAAAREMGFRLTVVGVHWDSNVGSMGKWMVKATGARFASLLGMKKALKNPYLEKTALAREVGRTGLRSVMFRIEDRFSGIPIHCLSHSLGAEVTVAALAPEAYASPRSAIDPGRTPRLGLVALVGADLDHDAFTRKNGASRMALRRAEVWWVTVPTSGTADMVLEFRRASGKPAALGTVGLKLAVEDLEMLLGRRALVLDQRGIPATHSMYKYVDKDRAETLAASMLYLQDRRAAAARACVLAKLDAVLAGGTPNSDESDHCVRFYAAWKAQPQKVAGVRFVHVGGADERGRPLNGSAAVPWVR